MQKTIAQQTRIAHLYNSPAWTLIAAFGAYFCMYGFHKPYTAATYAGVSFVGVDYKFWLIIAQTLGYVLAKWIGIKIVSEAQPHQRVNLLLRMILLAEGLLLVFAILPRPWNMICLLLNGLSLGIVFGLVLGFLEGRKNTEALVAGLCASFIVSDGVSKSVGALLLNNGITENWMPFTAGIVFLPPTLLFLWMLRKVAPPGADIAHRSKRVPMNGAARKHFFNKYWPGLVAISAAYLFVTLLRSIRADFAPELWNDLGYTQTPALFTQSEIIVSLGVMAINGLAVLIHHHNRAFRFSLWTCVGGFCLLLLSVISLPSALPSFLFMVLAGLGVYLPYVAIHTTVFERLIASTKEKATTGFLMYIVDSVGYSGYILLMLLRHLTPAGTSILSLFLSICMYLGIGGIIVIVYSFFYFNSKHNIHASSITSVARGQGSHL